MAEHNPIFVEYVVSGERQLNSFMVDAEPVQLGKKILELIESGGRNVVVMVYQVKPKPVSMMNDVLKVRLFLC